MENKTLNSIIGHFLFGTVWSLTLTSTFSPELLSRGYIFAIFFVIPVFIIGELLPYSTIKKVLKIVTGSVYFTSAIFFIFLLFLIVFISIQRSLHVPDSSNPWIILILLMILMVFPAWWLKVAYKSFRDYTNLFYHLENMANKITRRR